VTRDLLDEFDWIEALRPLTGGEGASLGLLDDAAVLAARPGFDLVISKDAMVEGVHFLPGESAGVVARRLLRTNLSDLAAKAAEPFGYLLMTAWPADRGQADRQAFIEGLAQDGARFGLVLLGGDTVATPGPLTVSATIFGWTPAGGALLRSGAKPGDALVVLGAIGDGLLGLRAALGEIEDPDGELAAWYRLPEPRISLPGPLRDFATAAADVSDGLLADVSHIAQASGCGVRVDLDKAPLSRAGAAWLARQPDRAAALETLCAGGDDYALACAAHDGQALVRAAHDQGIAAAIVGAFRERRGLEARFEGRRIEAPARGWRHRG
jgi:thiamine-monophosphate kinase